MINKLRKPEGKFEVPIGKSFSHSFHLKFLRVNHTFKHIHLTQENVRFFNELSTKVSNDVHDMFSMEFTLENGHWMDATNSHLSFTQ